MSELLGIINRARLIRYAREGSREMCGWHGVSRAVSRDGECFGEIGNRLRLRRCRWGNRNGTRISRVNRRPFAISVSIAQAWRSNAGNSVGLRGRARARVVEIDRRGFPPRAFHSSPFCPGHDLAKPPYCDPRISLRRDFQGRRGGKRGASRVVAQFPLLPLPSPSHLFSHRLISRFVVDNRFVFCSSIFSRYFFFSLFRTCVYIYIYIPFFARTIWKLSVFSRCAR